MLTATDNTTELDILEQLDFREEQICAFHELGECDDKAVVYIKRPPCGCYPEGRVFPVCAGWQIKHFWWEFLSTSCCNKRFPSSEVFIVGEVL